MPGSSSADADPMPMRAPRICACGYRIASASRCPCEAKRDKQRRSQHDSKRQSAAARGYDREWQKVRAGVLKAEPWCRAHAARGERVEAVEVDHIDGNPKNNATSNLRPLCKSCHSRRTARDQAFGRKTRGVVEDFRASSGDRAPSTTRDFVDFGAERPTRERIRWPR